MTDTNPIRLVVIDGKWRLIGNYLLSAMSIARDMEARSKLTPPDPAWAYVSPLPYETRPLVEGEILAGEIEDGVPITPAHWVAPDLSGATGFQRICALLGLKNADD